MPNVGDQRRALKASLLNRALTLPDRPRHTPSYLRSTAHAILQGATSDAPLS